jgi:nitroreductase
VRSVTAIPEVPLTTNLLPLTPDELLTTTRAVRRRIDCDRPVEREVVEECLQIALQAPTASNMQPWSFVVVTDPDRKAAIAEWYRKSWAAYEEMPFAAGNLPYEDPDRKALQQRVMDSATYLAHNFERMPVFVIPCLGMRPESLPDLSPSFVQATLYSSVIQAAWSLQLAARARGLGSCWTTLHLLYEREIGEILGIPYDQVCQAGLLTMGYCRGGAEFRPGPREPLESKIHWEAW